MGKAETSLILASSSKYRAQLLGRLGLPFDAHVPNIDESARPGEAPAALAQRLAEGKAAAIAKQCSDAVVIGSDQVLDLDGVGISKPGTLEAARAQLRSASGRDIVFHTAVCVRRGQRQIAFMDQTVCRFRSLSDAEINLYLAREPALDCAGSFKSEGLGISLFSAIESQDPTALVGLPLIRLCAALREFAIEI